MNNKVISKIISGTLLCSMVGYTLPVFAYTKDETVYSKMDSNGKNYKTIVSTHIKNTENADLINDLSDLLNVKNTSGDENYTQDGNKFVWNANKNDIYYQGESSKELPIECNVKYELDGKELSANEIAGKSGKVKITLQYTNKEERTVDINGKKVKMYVPFVVVAGTIIENENARNIEVSSGKVVDDGSKTVVVGMAMPGLQESLGLSDDEVEIPSNVEITMDATNFETSSIMSYVTPKVLEEDDLKVFDNLDEIYGQVNTLQTSMNQIQDGANTLKDGTTQLATGANTLKDGVTTAYNGAQTISSEVAKSTQSLKNDKSEALDSKTLESIKKQAAESSKLTDEQKAQIKAQAQTSAVLTDEQKAQIKAQAAQRAKLTEGQKAEITALAKQGAVLTEKQKAQITEKAKDGAQLTEAQKTAIITNAQANYPAITEAEKTLLIVTAQNTATQTAVNTALATAENTAKQTAVATALNVAQQVATQTAETTAVETAQQIATQTAVTTALTTAQSTATTTAMQTSTTVAKQVGNQAKKTFTNQVVSQMNTLGNGLNQLTSGLSELNNGATTLANGTNQVNDGATTLAEGIKTFNEEGIKKICNYINGDVKDLTTRVQKLTDLSKDYNNFTMLDGENDGEVKFIMIAEAVKKQEDSEQNKEEAVLSTNVINDENK
jgi:membrane protein-like protein